MHPASPGSRAVATTATAATAATALAVAAALALAPAATAPLGRLGSPFALLVVLPSLALALEAFGWSGRLAARLARVTSPIGRLLAGYGLWLLVSALLTLDVAAVAAATVGVDVSPDHGAEPGWQLGAGILGSNVGSMLFPFSNLTNLVLVGATGLGLVQFVELSALPQLVAALAVAVVLVRRAGPVVSDWPREGARADRTDGPGRRGTGAVTSPGLPALIAGTAAVAGGLGAIAAGVEGWDMAIPFALAGGVAAGTAVASGRLSVRSLAGGLPVRALAVVAVAAAAAGPLSTIAGTLPVPGSGVTGLLLALVVGGALAASLNNLPAAALGAAWLAHAPGAAVIAFLLGTNVVAIATPHGSAATMLVRDGGARRGVAAQPERHVRVAWQYALGGAIPALAVLALLAR